MIAFVVLAQLSAASPPPVRFELPNGLRVWVQEDHARPVALVQVTYHVGSLNETSGRTGIAHYVEHMVYRATENVRNEDIYGYIDRIGGRYTGGTWPNFTRYAETVPAWALESALRVTAERMSRALFDSLEFERERNNVVTEANGFRETDPASALRDTVISTALEVHPYRYSSNSWARDNLGLTRAQAYDWYRRYYGPNNAVLVVVGDVAADTVRRLVERHFAQLPRASEAGEIRVTEQPQQSEKRLVIRHGGVQKRLEIVYRAPAARDPEYRVLVAVDRLLASALSRFASQLRVTTSSQDTATAYPFVYRITVAGDSSADLDRALALIDSTIGTLEAWNDDNAKAATPGDTSTANQSTAETTNTNFPARQSNLTRVADRLSDRDMPRWELSPAAADSIRAASRSVTAAQIRSFAHRWLQPSRRTIGFLVQGGSDLAGSRLDVPAMTTPPEKRRRPEPVPLRALRPLEPVSIERLRSVMPNGIPVRAARTTGDRVAIRILVERGGVSDTLDRGFPAAQSDSAFAALARQVREVIERAPREDADTSVGSRARERVIAGLGVGSTQPGLRTTIAVAGPRAPAQLASEVARHFGALPRNGGAPIGVPSKAPRDARPERLAVPGAPQVTVAAGLPGVPRGHPDRLALELLNYIVGVPWYGGRLGWGLTKTGLTYSSAAITSFGADAGLIMFSTTCDTRNTESTIQAITEIVTGIGAAGVADWELREAQAFTLGRMLLYGARERSSPELLAVSLSSSEDAAVDHLDLPAWSKAYLGVTLADLNRVARTYYRPERLKIVAVGPLPSSQPRIFPDGTFRKLFEP
ncbi:MAG: M16 family metallopeptidase [Gemmatimonadaceae bacterium]